jgi:RNA polymerase sigma-70 factor (ECF subfamily)
MSKGHFFLPWNASKARLREAENARKNRLEIVKAVSQGTVSRRELFKWGLITGAGLVAPIQGLSPFVKSAYADGGGIPTGTPTSPGTLGIEFTQPMQRFEVLQQKPYRDPITNLVNLSPAPRADGWAMGYDAKTDPAVGARYNVAPELVNGRTGVTGPAEGRPPGPDWGHQRWNETDPRSSEYFPKWALEVTQDVFIQVLRKIGQLRDPERFGGWLRRIAVRLAINRAVRRPRETLGDNAILGGLPADTVNPFERVVASENAKCVRDCLDRLRDLDRRTLVAFYFEGRSIQEMSAEFDSPVGTIKRRLHTARNRLRDKLSDVLVVV